MGWLSLTSWGWSFGLTGALKTFPGGWGMGQNWKYSSAQLGPELGNKESRFKAEKIRSTLDSPAQTWTTTKSLWDGRKLEVSLAS